ncbi:MAG: VWA domain-containing protein [Chloroflexota bacterium]
MPSEKENLYSRLSLPKDASNEEIRRAYREAARRLHPDSNTKPGETELFLGIQEAYDVLSDPEKRSRYDADLPVEPPKPVVLSVTYSRSALQHGNEPQIVYALLDISPQKEARPKPNITPLNVCLLVDSSTSMQGVLMDTVKSTAVELINQLKEDDVLSVVSFNDRAEVLLPASKHTRIKEAEHAVQMLHARGGTELYRGLDAAFTEILRQRDANRVNHIVLLTDGRTYGDEEDCLRLAKQAASQHVGISCLGLGNDWNDELLDQLAKITGGSTTFVNTPREIRSYLKEQFNNLSKRYAENATYSFEIPSNVHLRYAFRLQPVASPLDTQPPVVLGSVPRGESLQVLVELLVESVSSEQSVVDLLSGRITLQMPFQRESQVTLRAHVSRPASAQPDAAPPPAAIVQAMSRLTLYRMQERAKEHLASGNIEEATHQLQNIATRLLADGETELARTVMEEIGYIQEKQSLSSSGSKRIKYGTRGLLLSAGS